LTWSFLPAYFHPPIRPEQRAKQAGQGTTVIVGFFHFTTTGFHIFPTTQPPRVPSRINTMPSPDRKLTQVELDRPTPQTHRARPKFPIRLILDDVRSRHNVGSIFRSADAFGVEAIILCGFTPRPPHREIEKTALGATRSVPWSTAENALAAVNAAKIAGYRAIAVEQTLHAVPIGKLPGVDHGPVALVFGNELNGVSEAVIEACDACAIIPQHGSKHSLNVSVCAGVALYAVTVPSVQKDIAT